MRASAIAPSAAATGALNSILSNSYACPRPKLQLWHVCCSICAALETPGGGIMNTCSAVSKTAIIAFAVSALCAPSSWTFAQPIDPGVRTAAAGSAPTPLPGLTADELAFYQDGLSRFTTVEVVSGASGKQGNGLGPRFNSDQCSSCHVQPYVGGSSPAVNPLMAIATADGATNTIPWFITSNGPIREARFVKSNGATDGGVHALFVITGRTDAGSCNISQPNFLPAGNAMTAQGGTAISSIASRLRCTATA